MSISKRVGRFLEVPIVRFVHSKACRRLGGLVRIVRFEHRKVSGRVVEVWTVGFERCKACRNLETLDFDPASFLDSWHVAMVMLVYDKLPSICY